MTRLQLRNLDNLKLLPIISCKLAIQVKMKESVVQNE